MNIVSLPYNNVKKSYFHFAVPLIKIPLRMMFLWLFLANSAISAATPTETVTISQTAACAYTIDVTAVYDIEPRLLLSICYDPAHLRQYLPKWVTIEVLQEDETMHVLAYEGTFLFYTNRSVYQRRFDAEHEKIFFSQLESSQNIALFPNIKKSDGFYEILLTEDGVRLHYQQTTEVDREVSEKDLRRAKKQIRNYFANLRAYINKIRPYYD